MSDAEGAGEVPGARLKELRIFLEDAFTAPQLEQFLVEHELQSVAKAVTHRGISDTSYAFQVAQELQRQNLLRHEFFAALLEERQHHEARIRSLEASFLNPAPEEKKSKLLSEVQIEELVDNAEKAGLLAYDVQVTILQKAEPGLLDTMKLSPGASGLLRSALKHLNERTGTGKESSMARWLSQAIPLADERGYGGPYRRALEVLSGAQFQAGEELDAAFPTHPSGRALPPGVLTIDFLSEGLSAAASVCRVRISTYQHGKPEVFGDGRPVSTSATGWLITPSLLITAWHNIVGPYHRGKPELSDVMLQARSMVCEFDYEKGVTGGTTLRASRLLAWKEESDIALVRLEGETQRQGLKPRPLSKGPLDPDERVSIIHHGFAKRKLLTLRNPLFAINSIAAHPDLPGHFRLTERVCYVVPQTPGSSGAPLFDDDWHLIGFHLGYVGLVRVGVQFGFGTPLDAIRQFLSGTDVLYEDFKLFQAALAEIKATWAA